MRPFYNISQRFLSICGIVLWRWNAGMQEAY